MVYTSDYYLWLESLVSDGNHYRLLRYLYEQPYRWQFTLDENRSAGGLNLRSRFAFDNGIDVLDVGEGPCSVLEMMIALADRMTEVLPYEIKDGFWVMIRNLHLDQFDDSNFDEGQINYILNVWLDRTYDSSGNGSLFPLKRYLGDCRRLDVWSQMNAWVSENYPHTDEWLYQ